MPDFAGPNLTEADMWGMTPFDQLYCRILYRGAKYQGYYTPPGPGPHIRTPGELGGIDWGSVAVDEGRGVLVVNSNLMADYDRFIPRAQADKDGLYINGDPRRRKTEAGAAMAGTPYGVYWHGFVTGLGIPCQRPPYGFLTAVDLKTGKADLAAHFGRCLQQRSDGICPGTAAAVGRAQYRRLAGHARRGDLHRRHPGQAFSRH